MNRHEPGQKVMLFCMPTRVIRLTAIDDSYRTFRVEHLQLTKRDPNDPKGQWATLSTHGSETPWTTYDQAMERAFEAQASILRKAANRQRGLAA